MRVSVVVPVYNEEETVALVLESLTQVPLDLEVVVVDDASTDRTWQILQELRQKEPFATYRFVRHNINQGKGAGFRTGFAFPPLQTVHRQVHHARHPHSCIHNIYYRSSMLRLHPLCAQAHKNTHG